jgi:hypothetical protein
MYEASQLITASQGNPFGARSQPPTPWGVNPPPQTPHPQTDCEAGICGFCIYGERSESHQWDARLVLLDQSGKRTDAAAPLLRIAAGRHPAQTRS